MMRLSRLARFEVVSEMFSKVLHHSCAICSDWLDKKDFGQLPFFSIFLFSFNTNHTPHRQKFSQLLYACSSILLIQSHNQFSAHTLPHQYGSTENRWKLTTTPFCGRQVTLVSFLLAILSVYNKQGLLDLAKGLNKHDIRLLASGGTAKRKSSSIGALITPHAFLVARVQLWDRIPNLRTSSHSWSRLWCRVRESPCLVSSTAQAERLDLTEISLQLPIHQRS